MKNILTIKRTNARNDDFISLVALLDQELAVMNGDDHAFYAQYSTLDSIQYALVAYLDDQPIACGALRTYNAKSVEIKRMYTRKNHRGQGYAQAVLGALEAWGAELGYDKCILETGLKQSAAIRLYSKAGYVQIPNYGPYANDENSRCFQKKI